MKKTTVRNGELVRDEVVKSAGNLKIIKAYANIENDIYANVYNNLDDLKREYPGEKYLDGYMVIDESIGYVPGECKDFCNSIEEAEDDIFRNFGNVEFDEIDEESPEYLVQSRLEDVVREKMESLNE